MHFSIKFTRLIGRSVCLVLAVGLITGSTGCKVVSSANKAIPANRLPKDLFDCPRESLAPLPFAALGQTKPADHIIGGGDTLSIYIFGVFPPTEEATPIVQRQQAINQDYYPARGSQIGPGTGLPIRVSAGGTIELPLIDPIPVAGLTVSQVRQELLQAYKDKDILQEGRERISVALLYPRLTRVVVLREDTPNPAVSLVSPQAVDQIHRGSGQVIDLPVYENDVLHAMAQSGGLPGTDAAREVYVIRNQAGISNTFLSAGNLQSMVSGQFAGQTSPGVIRIPLAGCPDEPIPFTEADITLGEGDVLFIPRRNEYFITGGLLPGGRVPLPRDEDVDVIEAIAMATGSAGGPLGRDGSVLAAGNVGNLREPTRVLILRKLPDGRQLTIRADLDRAVYDPNERIRILPNDVVMLQFKPSAAAIYSTLNWFSGDGVLNGLTRVDDN